MMSLARREAEIWWCPASWPTKPIWVKTNARNAATANCHQESPIRTKAVQPAASSAVVMAILRT